MTNIFENIRKSAMFAVSYTNARSGETTLKNNGLSISVHENIGYNTPSLMLNGSTAPCECKTEGRVIPFACLILSKHYSEMSYAENNVLSENNSIRVNTPTSAKTDLQQEIEAKNMAYAFILSKNQFSEFIEFAKANSNSCVLELDIPQLLNN